MRKIYVQKCKSYFNQINPHVVSWLKGFNIFQLFSMSRKIPNFDFQRGPHLAKLKP